MPNGMFSGFFGCRADFTGNQGYTEKRVKEERLMLLKYFFPVFSILCMFVFVNCDPPTNEPPVGPTDPVDRYIAVGNAGCIIYSDDYGETFTAVTSGTSVALRDVASDGHGHCVAVGDGGTVVYSDDYGITWHPGTVGAGVTTNYINGVASYGQNNFVAVGEPTNFYPDGAYRSTNGGSTWDTYSMTVLFKSVCVTDSSTFVAVGHPNLLNNAAVYITANGGTSWNSATINGSPNSMYRVIPTSGTWLVAVGENGTINSQGGYVWNVGNDTIGGRLRGEVYCNPPGRLIIVGTSTSGGFNHGTVYYSGSTGSILTEVIPAATPDELYDIAGNGSGRLVAVGANGEVISNVVTADPLAFGTQWTHGDSGVSSQLWGVGYVALGD